MVLSDDVYLESLLDYISTHDASSIREALRENLYELFDSHLAGNP